MNSNLDQKKVSVIEDALRLKDEGKRLSFIIEKFPDYESEIREIFGTVAFIKENKDNVIPPKNILKTLLSKIPDNSPVQTERGFKKEITRENNIYIPVEEDDESRGYDDSLMAYQKNAVFSKWKIIIPVIILGVVMGIILLRSDSRTKNEITDENMESSQESGESNSVPLNVGDTSSSTEEVNN